MLAVRIAIVLLFAGCITSCTYTPTLQKQEPKYDAVQQPPPPPEPPKIKVPPDKRKLGPKDLNYGRLEVNRMMKDRPVLGAVVQKGDVVYEWTARQFGGANFGRRIRWNSSKITSQADGDNFPAHSGGTPEIRVRKFRPNGKPMTAQQAWSVAVFELHNICGGPQFKYLDSQAMKGKLSKNDYIIGFARNEYAALIKSQRFYQDVWKPFLLKKGIAEEGETVWNWTTSPSFDEWYRETCALGWYSSYVGDCYDQVMAYEKQMRAYRRKLRQYQIEKARYDAEVRKERPTSP